MIDFISDEEREIVDYYLNQKKSIREICAIYKCGRTKINNALEKYAVSGDLAVFADFVAELEEAQLDEYLKLV